jgi:histidinol-phosphate aminotransferase
MYAMCARVQGARVVETPLRDDFTLDVDAVLAAVTPAVKLVFVCAPNNPSGAGVPRAESLRLAAALAGRALVVVDEAYVEFAEAWGVRASVADCIGKVENIVVLRTLSKAWALAGARIGTLLADARVVALLRKLMPPYPLSSPCVEVALRALSGAGARATYERTDLIRGERERMRGKLAGLGCVREVLPSAANFLAVRFADASATLAALLDAGVVVRDVRRYPMLGDALRISVGAPAENDRALAVLDKLAPSAGTHGKAACRECTA